jgi:hypothetical protein
MTCDQEINLYQFGSYPTVQGTFTQTVDDVTTNVDPATIYLETLDPNGNLETYQYGVGSVISKEAVGVYQVSINANLAGRWYYRWYSSTPQASDENGFDVEASYTYNAST